MRTTVKIRDFFQKGVQYLTVLLNALDYYTLGEVNRSLNTGNKTCIHNQL